MGFRDWFRTPVQDIYNPVSSNAGKSTDTRVKSDPGQLGQSGNEPVPGVPDPGAGQYWNDELPEHPDYDASPMGPYGRHIFEHAGQDPYMYEFLRHDLTVPEDAGSVPGTAFFNSFNGPVDGNAMDVWQEGAHAQVPSREPGYYGPVTGYSDADYAQMVSHAYFQQQFADYSPLASTDAMVAAV